MIEGRWPITACTVILVCTIVKLLFFAHNFETKGKSSTKNGEIERFFKMITPIDNDVS